MVAFPSTKRPTTQVFELDRQRYFLATEPQVKGLPGVKRAWDTATDSRQGNTEIGQPFEVPLADFHEGYGFTFAPVGRAVYEQADGWDVSAPDKATTWPRLATCESVTDTNYRGWLYFDYTSGYMYMFRGKYSTKYHPEDTVNGTWPILEFHEFGSGNAVAGKPAVFNGKVYVPLLSLADGSLQKWHELTTIAAPVTSVQTIAISGTPTGGTWTITYNDGVSSATTAAMVYNSSASQVQSALRLLPGLQKVTVTSTGSTPNFTYTITLTGAPTVQGSAVPYALTVTDNTTGGTHAITPSVTTAGSGDTWTTGPSGHESSYFTVWNKPTTGPLLVLANANTIQTCATTPTSAGNWSAGQSCSDSTFNITALATLGRFLMVARPDGLFSFDESGTVVSEIPAISAVTDSQNGIGMTEANGWLYMPHKLGTIRWRMGSPWSLIGAEEDQRLEGDITVGGWGRVVGIAPYGKYTYVTVNDYLNTVSTIASWQPPTQNRQPVNPHMHHSTTSVLEDAAIAVLKSQPVAPNNFVTFSDDNSVGTQAWQNPGFAQLDDGQQATEPNAGTTHYLKALNGEFGIPTSSTINGIQLDVKKSLVLQGYSVGPTNPGTGTNFAGVGTNAWTNPGNITAADSSYATNSTAGVTQGLRASNFGFSIPSTATLNGITVGVTRHATNGTGPTPNTPTNAGTCANDASVGTNSWSALTNAQGTPGLVAAEASVGGSGGTSNYLTATNFGITVPGSGTTILGIAVRIKKSTTQATSVTDADVKLVKGGTIQGNNEASGSAWGQGASNNTFYSSYGGSADLWGLSLSQTDVQSSGFGVAIAGVNNNVGGATLYVSGFEITVYYQTAEGLVDSFVSLISASSAIVGSNYASGSNWPTSDATASYGGSNDLWGTMLTPVDVNSSNFGAIVSVTIPTSGEAFVDTITITINYQDGAVTDSVVKLVKAGSVVGNNYADTVTHWPLTEQFTTYGGATDLWGQSWTPADVNNSTFGAVVSAVVTSGTAAVEYMRIWVYFTLQGIGDPASYLAVITLDPNANNATATPIIYKLPRAGLTVSNDPNIDKATYLGADLRTSRNADPSRAVLKQWQSFECYLTLEPEGGTQSTTLTPGVQIQAQIDDSGTWTPLISADGEDTLFVSGAYEMFFPVGIAYGHWVQIRVYMPPATAAQTGLSVTMRNGVLRGFLIPKNTDQVTAVVVLREGGQFEDGYTEKRSILQQIDDLDALNHRDPELGPIQYHDPTNGEDGWLVVQGVALQEKQFIPGAASQWVATVKGRRVPYSPQ